MANAINYYLVISYHPISSQSQLTKHKIAHWIYIGLLSLFGLVLSLSGITTNTHSPQGVNLY